MTMNKETHIPVEADPMENVEEPVKINVDRGIAYPWELYGGWKPNTDETYFYISEFGAVLCSHNIESIVDVSRVAYGNCFKTRDDAELAAIVIRGMLLR